ncbi:MAG TPA: ABC transporter permease [Spirochaetia bacterium]|nr:ABC transporter permease [Spirochaetia bacterium]
MNFSRRGRALAALVGPSALFLCLFFLLPLAFVLLQSFQGENGAFSLHQYASFLRSPRFLIVYGRTLKFGIMVTALSALLAYPASYALVRMDKGKRSVLMSIVILPLMTSPVARTYAWLVILGRFGLINQLLRGLGITHEPARLLYTQGAIVVGLAQLFLPLMVLSLVSALENIPPDSEEAALSLGANRLTAFFRVILPLSADGFILGSILVFTGSITAYVTPAILGGTGVLTLATLMQQEALVLMNWTDATIIAVVMVLSTLVFYLVLRRLRPETA